jgi:hypothetical protein
MKPKSLTEAPTWVSLRDGYRAGMRNASLGTDDLVGHERPAQQRDDPQQLHHGQLYVVAR